MGAKGHKVRHAFLTHADRDHIAGLLQFNQLNSRDGIPEYYYPKDCGSFPALQDFMGKFDPQSGPGTWIGLSEGDSIDIGKGLVVEARKSLHVTKEDQTKALDYTLCRVTKSLKPEFRGLEGPKIAALRTEYGENHIQETHTERWIGYSGDSPSLDPNHWENTKILFHEATFLDPETAKNAHSNLPQVLSAASQMDLEALVLLHFSSRYKQLEIQQAVRKLANQHQPKFPIYAVYPSEPDMDILSGQPAWEPGSTSS